MIVMMDNKLEPHTRNKPIFKCLIVFCLLCIIACHKWTEDGYSDHQHMQFTDKHFINHSYVTVTETRQSVVIVEGGSANRTMAHNSSSLLRVQHTQNSQPLSKKMKDDSRRQILSSLTDVTFSRAPQLQFHDSLIKSSNKLFNLYNKYENRTGLTSSTRVLTHFPYFQILDLSPKLIQYLPNIKNPCFFVKVSPISVVLQCLPNIFLVGVAKCGTTDLAMRLNMHQQIMTGVRKEIGWWSKNKEYASNTELSVNLYEYGNDFKSLTQTVIRQGVEYYTSHEDASGGLISDVVGLDASPFNYRMRDGWTLDIKRNFNLTTGELEPRFLLPHKIQHLLPNSKILFILREPGERALSHFCMNANNKQWNLTPENFHEMVSQEIQWFRSCVRRYSAEYCSFMKPEDVRDIARPEDLDGKYILSGMYSVYIRKWLEVFPRENLLFINLETYGVSPINYISDNVLAFINLGPYDSSVLVKLETSKTSYNTAKKKIVMSQESRQLIDEFFEPYNRDLIKLLGEEFEWKSK